MTHRRNIADRSRLSRLLPGLLLPALVMAGCATSNNGANAHAAAKPQAPSASLAAFPQIKTLRLSDAPDPLLPEGNGRETVQTYCGMCHTSHYIVTQPRFSREVWTAEMTKMRKVFSGPIPEEKVPEIVAYLVAIDGAPSTPKK